jgi:hypothetical protein
VSPKAGAADSHGGSRPKARSRFASFSRSGGRWTANGRRDIHFDGGPNYWTRGTTATFDPLCVHPRLSVKQRQHVPAKGRFLPFLL